MTGIQSTNFYLISDTHFSHSNLIKRGVRKQFASCEEHDNTIIENWNKTVKRGDLVYMVGDIVWGGDFSFLGRLNGQKIIIKGNHDKIHDLKKAVADNHIANFYYHKLITVGNNKIYMQHFPCTSWEGSCYGSYHAYGHSHGTGLFSVGRSMDVSVDCINYTPIHVEDFIKKLEHRNNKYIYCNKLNNMLNFLSRIRGK